MSGSCTSGGFVGVASGGFDVAFSGHWRMVTWCCRNGGSLSSLCLIKYLSSDSHHTHFLFNGIEEVDHWEVTIRITRFGGACCIGRSLGRWCWVIAKWVDHGCFA